MFDRQPVLICQDLPTPPHIQPYACNGLPGALAFHDFQRLDGSGRSDALAPEAAADEGRLGCLHDLATADRRGDGIAIANRLAKNSHIRLDTVFLVEPSEGLTKA